MDRNFGYPTNVRIRIESNKGEPRRDTILNIEYEQRVPFCANCEGYGHWSQKCRKLGGDHWGGWNLTIAVAKAPVSYGVDSSGEHNPAKTQKFQNQKKIKNSTQKAKDVVPDHIKSVESDWNIDLSNQATSRVRTENLVQTNN